MLVLARKFLPLFAVFLLVKNYIHNNPEAIESGLASASSMLAPIQAQLGPIGEAAGIDLEDISDKLPPLDFLEKQFSGINFNQLVSALNLEAINFGELPKSLNIEKFDFAALPGILTSAASTSRVTDLSDVLRVGRSDPLGIMPKKRVSFFQ